MLIEFDDLLPKSQFGCNVSDIASNMQIKIMIIKNIYAMPAFTRFAGSMYGKPRGFM